MMPGMPQNINGAAQRAASALHQRYGPAAAHQVQRLQTQAPPMPGYMATTQPMQRPAPASAGVPATISNGQHQSPQLQYQNPPPPVQQQQQQQQQQQPNEQPPVPGPRPPVSNAQVDGACDANALSDWKAEVHRRREAAREQQGLIRDYVESRGLAMEGNGLMRPLQEVIRDSGKTKNRGLQVASVAEAPEASVKPRRPAGYDGADDDDDDAINSDLDDPEDPVDGEDAEGEAVGQNMLCTYDKVQRVKNKWKCTLKDGVLSCGGKE
ncbi:RNA polymerase II mediator complex subunit [Ascosphaera pollenicola]|nr:RNA polymerase II mediator complex subunit [Ascosphaera pollenicola]